MSIADIISVIFASSSVILGAVSYCLKTNSKLKSVVGKFISQAETLENVVDGNDKFLWVVNEIENLIPVAVRPFIPKSVIQTIVQEGFDALSGYAKVKMGKVVANVGDKVEGVVGEATTAVDKITVETSSETVNK